MLNKKLIFIVGPTASGKSKVAFELARKYKSALVNCDSLQVYEDLSIGTAKPSNEELSPYDHYLFGFVKKGEEFTAGKFRKEALKIINETDHENYIFVGGSGFYIKALTEGMFEEVPLKQQARDKVKKLKHSLSKEQLFLQLQKLDPEYALKIHQNDQYRVGRALELILSLNKSMSKISEEFYNKSTKLNLPMLYIGMNVEREVLRQKVTKRLQLMLDKGFKSEVESLLELRQWKPMSSVGYKEMISLIDGQIDENEFKQEAIKNTMRLAKRQMTWFKANKLIHWFSASEFDSILRECDKFLNAE